MKKNLIFVFLFIGITCYAQDWVFQYPGAGSVNGIVETSDGNVIIQSDDGTISKIDVTNGDLTGFGSFREPISTSGQNHVWQSLARIGNNVLAVKDENWFVFDENTGNISNKQRVSTSANLGYNVITRITRVKELDGYFYIIGGYLTPINSQGYSRTGGFITKISPTGTVLWSKMNQTISLGGSTGLLMMGIPVLYTDVELHPDGSGDLILSSSEKLIGLSLVNVDAGTGSTTGVHFLWNTQGDINYIATDMLVIPGAPSITIVGYSGAVVPFSGSQKTFALSFNTANNSVLWASESIESSGTGDLLFFTDVFETPSGFGGCGMLLSYQTGESRLFVSVDGEKVVIDDSQINSFTNFDMPGSHCILRVGQYYYIGTQNSNNLEPMLIKKEIGTPMDEVVCATDVSIENQNCPIEYLDFITPQPDVDIDVIPQSINVEPGAVKENYCCDNFYVTISGNLALCGGGSSILTATSLNPLNTYNWYSPDGLMFQINSGNNSNQVVVNHAWNSLGYYELCVEATTPEGCISTECVTFKIVGPIPSSLPSTICEPDDCVIFLGQGGNSGQYTVTGTGVTTSMSGSVLNFEFCPSIAGVGNHTIQIYDNILGCSETLIIQVQPGNWPKTTENTEANDAGVDIDVDGEANVYSLGQFTYFTQFDNYNVTTNVPGVKGMMLSKVNECGEILWIANSTERNVEVVKLDVNEDLRLIYVTGNYVEGAVFHGGVDATNSPVCFGGQTSIQMTTSNSWFLAIYTFDGCLVEVAVESTLSPNNPAPNVEAQAVASHEFSSQLNDQRVYLLLKETGPSPNSPKYLHLKAITPNFNSGNISVSLTQEWTTSVMSSNDCQANDMVSYGDKVYFVGDFKRDLLALNLPGAQFLTTIGLSWDAFIYGVRDIGSSPVLMFNQDLYTTTSEPHNGTAMGVTANAGRVYTTGSCVQTVADAFGGSTTLTNYSANNNRFGYVMEMNTSGGIGWIYGLTGGGTAMHYVRGRSIYLSNNNDLCIAGMHSGNKVLYQDYVSPASDFAISTSQGTHEFILRWDDPSLGFYSPDEWANASNLTHKPVSNAIAATGDEVYTTGAYLFTMGMINNTTGPIVSTGAGSNLYIWRNGLESGIARSEELSPTEFDEETKFENDALIVVAPNPANDAITIIGEIQENAIVEIWDLSGRKVLVGNLKESRTINISEFESGMYFLRIIGPDSQQSTLFVKI